MRRLSFHFSRRKPRRTHLEDKIANSKVSEVQSKLQIEVLAIVSIQ